MPRQNKKQLRNVGNDLKRGGSQARNTILGELGNSGKEIYGMAKEDLNIAKEKARDMRDSAEEFIVNHPWLAVSGALAVGAVIGLGIGASMKKKTLGDTLWDKIHDWM
jgi:ElaB/YqjD/DUF883 family membrane-anchored ribosome-binding protein